MRKRVNYDEIGCWSEAKLDIVRDYATEYSKILAKQPRLYHVYIDAFAGAGVHVAKTSRRFVPGSPVNALNIAPPFREYFFIDLDRQKVESLRERVAAHDNVHLYEGDCNGILLEKVFPNVQWAHYRRALCLLDPYGLHLNWEVIETAGKMKTVEVFLNFPVTDMNRNVLWRVPENVSPQQIERMDAFWGDRSWREAAYTTEGNLFGYEEKVSSDDIARAFQRRLREVAGFEHVPDPIRMRNTTGHTLYYLFFASQRPVADHIVSHIFDKYRKQGAE